MDTKIFFTDLDEILLSTDKTVCAENREAIKRLLKEGHKFVLASGRSLPSVKEQACRLSLNREGCYAICYNGGQIYDLYQNQTIFDRKIPREMIPEIIKIADEEDIHVQGYDEQYVISRSDNETVRKYCEVFVCDYITVDDIADYLKEGSCKMEAVDYYHHDALDRVRKKVISRHGDVLDSFYSGDYYLEIVPLGANKGFAVHELCRILNIPVENTVAAGDAMNDLTMLKAAHIGAAVCNGKDYVRKAADYVTEADNNHGGVAEIIRRFIL